MIEIGVHPLVLANQNYLRLDSYQRGFLARNRKQIDQMSNLNNQFAPESVHTPASGALSHHRVCPRVILH